MLTSRREESGSAPTAEMGRGVSEEDERKIERTITLKSGHRMHAGLAAALVEEFRTFLLHQPDRFLALRRLVDGGQAVPSPEIVQEFRERALLTADDGLKPEVREVFLASFRETPDGPCFVEPFQPRDQEEAAKLRDLQHSQQQWLARFLKPGRASDDDLPPRT